jgi:putative DNA primase/helicase
MEQYCGKVNPVNDPANIRAAVQEAIDQEREAYAAPVCPQDAPEGPRKFSEDELSHALRDGQDGDAWIYEELHRGRFCFDHSEGQWYVFRAHNWEPDIVREYVAALDHVIAVYVAEAQRWGWLKSKALQQRKKDDADACKAREDAFLKRVAELHNLGRKKAVIELGSAGANSLGITGTEWDADPWLLGCANGVIHLRDGSFREGSPEEYIRCAAPTEWRGIHEPCPVFEMAIREILKGCIALTNFLQRVFGYAVTGLSVEHILVIFWGSKGRNGKGTLLELLAFVLGLLAGPIKAEVLLDQGRARSSAGPDADIMTFRGKRLVWASETDDGRKFNVGKVKWLVGGDSLKGRVPFGRHEVQFAPTHTLFLLTNHCPRADASDAAFWERVFLIPFERSFVDRPTQPHEKQRDPRLLEKLKAEAPGILAWLVRGCLEWQREGLNPPAEVRAATSEYRAGEDTLGQFIVQCCLVAPQCRVQAGNIRAEYECWCEENGHRPVSGYKFSKYLVDRFQRDDSSRYRWYVGVGLKDK